MSFLRAFREKEPNEGQHHQADPANITLDDPFDSYQAGPSLYNRFERFDIEGDDETQNTFPSQGRPEIPPPATVHSPPPETRPQRDDNIHISPTANNILGQQPVDQANVSSPQLREDKEQPQKQLQKRKTVRQKARSHPLIMDMEQTMIPSNMYQTWLQDSVDIRVKRPKVIEHGEAKATVKLAKLVDLPPVALSCGLVGKDHETHYPQPLLDLWMISIQPLQDSPSGMTTSPHPPEPSSSSPPLGQRYQDPPEIPMGDFGNVFASEERMRNNLATRTDIPIDQFNLMPNNDEGIADPTAPFSVPSPGPGLDPSNTSNSFSERLRKKRPSSTKFNSAGLESLDEENQWIHEAAEQNLAALHDHPQPSVRYLDIPDMAQPLIMVTYTSYPPCFKQYLCFCEEFQSSNNLICAAIDEEAEVMANNITTHLKTYFETPGAPQTESLNQLAFGMNRKQAAQLFYQTCVLATRDVLKVQQNFAYGDITICRGAKISPDSEIPKYTQEAQ
ncbi:Sister chromatid cohesion 1 protein 1, partial [Bienertia sinuspersici]